MEMEVDLDDEIPKVLLNFSKKTLKPNWYYMEIRIVFETKLAEFDGIICKNIILHAMRSLFGAVGGTTDVDVIKLEKESQTAIIRIQESNLNLIWGSLTLLGQYDEKTCRIEVLRTTPFLSSLRENSRYIS